MNSLVLIVLTTCSPGADPLWAEVPLAASYSSWGNGGAWQSVPPREGRHGFFRGRRGHANRKSRNCNCARPGQYPAPGYGVAMPGSVVSPVVVTEPAEPVPAPAPTVTAASPVLMPTTPTSVVTPPAPSAPLLIPNEAPAAPANTKLARPLPRGEPSLKEPF